MQTAPVSDLEQKRPKVRHLSLRLPPEVHEGLVELAKDSERTLAGQLRYILKSVAEDPDLLRDFP